MAEQTDMFPEEQPAEGQKAVERDQKYVDPEREAQVTKWQDRILRAREKYKNGAFKRMREDMMYARTGCTKEWEDAGKYRVPIVRRHINNAVSVLYARNPKAVVKMRDRIDTIHWSGDPQDLRAALDLLGQEQDPMLRDPQALAIVEEAIEIKQRKQMIDKVGKTLQILYNYYINEPMPNFKIQFKQAVRRAKTCGVAYVKVGFQRLMETDFEVTAQLDDQREQVARLERMMADIADEEIGQGEAELDEARSLLADLEARQEVLASRGADLGLPAVNQRHHRPMLPAAARLHRREVGRTRAHAHRREDPGELEHRHSRRQGRDGVPRDR